IFCADKTGTLTQNQMHVAEPVVIGSHTEQELFLTAALASRDQESDPIEQPIFAYIEEHHPDIDWQSYEVRKFVPFDPTIKRTEATVEKDGKGFVAMKGAAQVLMSLSDLDDASAADLTKKVDELAAGGYRTLAVGRREPEGDVVELIGLIPLYDPPRDDSKSVIAEMNANGVEVKMVTGDNLAIAREIGRLLGLPQRTLPASALSGSAGAELLDLTRALTTAIYSRLQPGVSQRDAREFANDVMTSLQESYDTRMLEHEFLHTHESALVEIIEEASIFAEVIPEDKFRIVDSLQKRGHIVGMTGDGVNDAPALKRADCGIAVSGATDAARAAADIILTGTGLDVINAAIVQARTTFGRMKSYATFRIAETVRIILFMTLSIIVFEFYPITPLMIILLALLNDIPILAIAYDHTKIEKRPVRWNMTSLLAVSVTLGLMGVLASFLLYYIVKEYGFSDDVIRTLMFLKLIVAGHSTLYVTRVEGAFFRRPFPSPLLFGATFATEIIGTLIAVFGIMVTPIPWTYALLIWGYALAWFVVNDMVKIAVVKLLHQGNRDTELRQATPETAG
ncbi:MAG: HAD-IC family P-type ATPase, partial [Pseudomonadales bacterium]